MENGTHRGVGAFASREATIVPGVDFHRLRTEVAIERVLSLLGFEPSRRRGMQWYGRCPLRECRSARGQSFSVHVGLGRYCCHRCLSRGNAIELWAAALELPLHRAAIELCRRLGRDVPWIHRW
jgi:CHC2 zinc finger